MASDPQRPIRDRFAGLKALQRPSAPLPITRVVVPIDDDAEERSAAFAAGSQRLASILGATVKSNCYGDHLRLHCWQNTCSPCTPTEAAMRLFAPEAHEYALDPQQWLFLDTETTGLSGGTGTYPFLVGIAWWEGGGLEIEQLFMREYSEERSLLAALAERLEERPVLVTFNGKSFDWPLLETRYRMTRKLTVPTPKAHLDFLHPARNLWRLKLGSARLAQLERHVLAWDRGDDLPSEQIPRIYQDFVRCGNADPLVPVFLHNQMDLRGLAGLANRILTLLAEDESSVNDGFELYGLSRMCERRGETSRARKLYEQTIGSELPKGEDRVARGSLARLAKGDGDWDRARELWESVLGNSREGYEAYEQLAIYFEHHARQPQRALSITHEALAQLRCANQTRMIQSNIYQSTRDKFEHRRSRLERKLGQTSSKRSLRYREDRLRSLF
jgi:uncharacterized protein YprB with RNaseH-like and TPR domain